MVTCDRLVARLTSKHPHDKAEPEFKSRDADTGEVTWEFKLKPNEKQKITVEYEVDAPYDQPVAGI